MIVEDHTITIQLRGETQTEIEEAKAIIHRCSPSWRSEAERHETNSNKPKA